MQPGKRKLVTIVAETVVEKELIESLEKLGVKGYTITDARGKGHQGFRGAGWEHGSNIRIEIVCDESLAEKITAYLQQNYYENFAMIVFVAEVSVLRLDKF